MIRRLREWWNRPVEAPDYRRQALRGEGFWASLELEMAMRDHYRAFKRRGLWRRVPPRFRCWAYVRFFLPSDLVAAIEAEKAAWEAAREGVGK